MAPTKVVIVPRLELIAAIVSAVARNFLREELDLKVDQEFFWTSSQVVLRYIKNDARRFPVFVANRVQKIRNSAGSGLWFYVETDPNPADHASRGLTVTELMKSSWFTGPKSLRDRELITIQACPEFIIRDPEARVLKTTLTQRESFLDRLSRLSDWNRALDTRIKRMVNKSQSGQITVTKRGSSFLCNHQSSPKRDMGRRVQIA